MTFFYVSTYWLTHEKKIVSINRLLNVLQTTHRRNQKMHIRAYLDLTRLPDKVRVGDENIVWQDGCGLKRCRVRTHSEGFTQTYISLDAACPAVPSILKPLVARVVSEEERDDDLLARHLASGTYRSRSGKAQAVVTRRFSTAYVVVTARSIHAWRMYRDLLFLQEGGCLVSSCHT